MGQKEGQKIPLDSTTDSNGEIFFNSKQYLEDINRFEITIEHKDYYAYPKNRIRRLCRSYEYGHLCEEIFEKIPTFYFNGRTLNISQYENSIKKYALKNLPNQDSQNQTQKEYYIQLQENQKNFKIYTDENLTQESEYILHLEDSKPATTQDEEQKKLYFNGNEELNYFKKEIKSIMKMNKKKGNTQSIHRFIIDYGVPDFIAKALQYIEEFEVRESSGVFLDEKLRGESSQIQEVISNLKKSQRFKGWKEQVYKLQQYENTTFKKQHIISLLKERIVNLVVTKQHTTNAILPATSNPTKSYYPNQGHTSLCGPAAFFYCLLIDRPDLYVKCVIDLWERGEAQIKNLRIKPSKSCKKPKSLMKKEYDDWADYINGADWITLAGLRDSENMILDYDEESDRVAGITLEKKIK